MKFHLIDENLSLDFISLIQHLFIYYKGIVIPSDWRQNKIIDVAASIFSTMKRAYNSEK